MKLIIKFAWNLNFCIEILIEKNCAVSCSFPCSLAATKYVLREYINSFIHEFLMSSSRHTEKHLHILTFLCKFSVLLLLFQILKFFLYYD